MKTLRIAVLLGAISAGSIAFCQEVDVDYSIEILQGGVPFPGGDVVYALVITADWWTDAQEPFVVRLTVPPGLEPTSRCAGEMEYDAATRLLIWTDRLDNPYLAFNSCPLVFRVDPSVAPGSSFVLAATLATSATDRNPSNNASTFTGVVIASSDLEVTSAVDVPTYKPGATVTYTFTVTNDGPQDAHDLTFADDVSQHLSVVSFEQTSGPSAFVTIAGSGPVVAATIPVLRSAESATFRIVARAKTNFEAAIVRNRVTVSSTSYDPRPGNNERDLWTFAGPDADLKLASARDPGIAGLRIPVSIHVSNSGPDAVNSVMVSNALGVIDWTWDIAEHVKIVSVTPSQGNCSAPVLTEIIATPPPPPHWTFDCTLGALASGGGATITAVIERTRQSGAFRLSSAVHPGQNDPRPENNGGQLVFDRSPSRRRSVGK